MTLKNVAVLMSTYNGEKYLKEQLDSLFTQKGAVVSVFVRDDGSTDNTLSILKDYEKDGKLTILESTQNLGVGNSFMELVYRVPLCYDYYAFCDQDDVWLEDKVKRAISLLSNYDKAALYCSNQVVVDSNLTVDRLRYKSSPNTSYLQILTSNQLTGCTMLWNRSLQQLLADSKRRPNTSLLQTRIHDVWVAMVASVIGEIVYDDEARILYRQHGNNVVGVKNGSLMKNYLKKIKNVAVRNGRSKLATGILDNYPEFLSRDTKENLAKFSNSKKGFKEKLILFNSPELFQFSSETRVGILLKILFNLI
ncbi:glycosyltransferase family 2 protein [Streptococcus ovuberis]|uniref:Glycosyltransferase family 2 protein n=1 Tax=Streptococcus ovuberis TaxID=1936207 RepID=A0A7X6S0Q5_9STRE|nr:glycosyltransferase family 2 protein [Streptococcus ovuberis]NKZ19381.1 glycosyltransferase family 2 protein [Streptococcus ovuberis]